MRRVFNFLIAFTLVCLTVSAKTYKVAPKTNPPVQQSNSGYNVYTPNNYTQTQVQNGVEVGGIIEFLIDYSGSMSNEIEQTKYIIQRLYNKIPAGTKIGLRVFGQEGGYNPYTYTPPTEAPKISKSSNGVYKVKTPQAKYDCIGNTIGGCSNTVQVLPVGLYDGYTFLQAMNRYNIGGATPLVFALYLAVNKDLANFPKTSAKKIILLTDGGETCSGNPCEYAKKLMQERSDIIVDVVIFGTTNNNNLACVANVTGGRYYTSQESELYNGIFESLLINSIQTAPRVPNKETTQPVTPQNNNSSNYEYVPQNK